MRDYQIAYDNSNTEHYLTAFSVNALSQSNKNLTHKLSPNFSQEMISSLLNQGFSKYSLAQKLKVSKSTIQRILNGQIKAPKPIIFSKLLGLYCTLASI